MQQVKASLENLKASIANLKTRFKTKIENHGGVVQSPPSFNHIEEAIDGLVFDFVNSDVINGTLMNNVLRMDPVYATVQRDLSNLVSMDTNPGRTVNTSKYIEIGDVKILVIALTDTPGMQYYIATDNRFFRQNFTGDTLPRNTLHFDMSGPYLVAAANVSPWIQAYSVSATTGNPLVRLTFPNVINDLVNAIKFAREENILGVAHRGGKMVTTFFNNNGTFVKMRDIDDNLPVSVNAITMDDKARIMALGLWGGDNIALYRRGNDYFSHKLDNPDILPISACIDICMSGNGNVIALVHNFTPFITVYKRIHNQFIKLPNPDVLPTGAPSGVVVSKDGTTIGVSHANAPRMTVYAVDGDIMTKYPNPSSSIADNGVDISISDDNQFLTLNMSGSASNRLRNFKFSGDYQIRKSDRIQDLANVSGIGYANQTGNTGSTIEMVRLIR